MLSTSPARGRSVKVKPDAYSVTRPPVLSTEAAFLVYYRGNFGLSAAGHAQDGRLLGDLGSTLTSGSAGRSFAAAPSPLGQGSRLALDDGEIVVLDFLAGARYAYLPPPPWVAAVPGEAGGLLYWFEIQPDGSDPMPIRLMRASDPTFADPPDVVRADTVALGELVLDQWLPETRGHDFADEHAGAFIAWRDVNGEIRGWERVMMRLDGSPLLQRDTSIFPNVPDVGVRAGLALDGVTTLTQRTPLDAPPESGAYPVQKLVALESSPEADYAPWGDEPAVVDMALNASRSTAYMLTGERQILTYSLASESLLSAVQLDIRQGDAVGIHRLETPIPFIEEPEE